VGFVSLMLLKIEQVLTIYSLANGAISNHKAVNLIELE